MFAIQRPDGSFVRIGDWWNYEAVADLFIVHPDREIVERILEEETQMVGGTDDYRVVLALDLVRVPCDTTP